MSKLTREQLLAIKEHGDDMAQALHDIVGEMCAREGCKNLNDPCPEHGVDLSQLAIEWDKFAKLIEPTWMEVFCNKPVNEELEINLE